MFQIEYWLRRCGNICFGLFNTYRPCDAQSWQIRTLPFARPVETGRVDGSMRVMFAHIIATLGKRLYVTDHDILIPHNWRDPSASCNSPLGHQVSGRTICLHSFSVCPEVQGVGIGKTAMKAYIQMMNESGIADRIALICKEVAVFFSINMHGQALIDLLSLSSAFSSKLVLPASGKAKRRLPVLTGTTW